MKKTQITCMRSGCNNGVSQYKYCKDCRDITNEKKFKPTVFQRKKHIYVSLLPVGIGSISQTFIVSFEDMDIVNDVIWWFDAKDNIVCKDREGKIKKLTKLLARGKGKVVQIIPGLNYTKSNINLIIDVIYENELGIVQVPLSEGKGAAKIDLDMVKYVRGIESKLAWQLTKDGYAKNSKVGFMHRYIMSIKHGEDKIKNMLVDHINGNRLDNRFDNLRIASPKENAINRTNDPKHGKYLGVEVRPHKFKSNADMYVTVYKGIDCYFSADIVRCALCYDTIAKYCKGEFARTNSSEVYNFNESYDGKPFPITMFDLSDEVMAKLDDIKNKHSQFDGVHKTNKGWKASIKIDVGPFENEERAAVEYDLLVLLFKQQKKLNFSKMAYNSDDLQNLKKRLEL